MKFLVLISFIFAPVFIVLKGCDLPPIERNADDDIANIESSLDETLDHFEAMYEGDFFRFLQTFLGADNGEFESMEWATDMFEALGDHIDFESIENNRRFDYSAHRRLYEWSRGSGSWTAYFSNILILVFPSSEQTITNDMSFVMDNYQDIAVQSGDHNVFLPTRIQSVLNKDTEPIFHFLLNQAHYNRQSEYPDPELVDLELFTAPYFHLINWNQNTGNTIRFQYEMRDDQSLAFGITLEMQLDHDNYDELDFHDVHSLSADFQFTDALSFLFDGSLSELHALEDPTEDQINEIFSAEINYRGDTIADIIYSEEADTFIVVYQDETSEPLERYTDYFFDRLDNIFRDFTGDQPVFSKVPGVPEFYP